MIIKIWITLFTSQPAKIHSTMKSPQSGVWQACSKIDICVSLSYFSTSDGECNTRRNAFISRLDNALARLYHLLNYIEWKLKQNYKMNRLLLLSCNCNWNFNCKIKMSNIVTSWQCTYLLIAIAHQQVFFHYACTYQSRNNKWKFFCNDSND